MYKIVSLLLLQAFFSNLAFSQNCIPDPNPQPGSSCFDAPFLCCGEVNGLSGTLPVGPNVNGPSPLCPNSSTVANNIEWVSFAAGSTSITLDLLIDNCTAGQGGNGVQVGIYDDCDFNNSIYCNGAANLGLVPIALNDLIIGEVYHLFIDGFSGSVCDYSFTVTDGNTFAPLPQSPSSISGALALCEGAPAQTYLAPLGQNSSLNFWTVTPGDVTFTDNGENITVTDWGSAVGGTATICVEGLNDCYLNPTGLNQACITVQVNEDQMQLAQGSYCEEEVCYVFPENSQCYSAGVHNVSVPNPNAGLGCDIVYELTVEEFVAVDLDSSLILCPGEPYIVNGTPFWPPLNGLAVPFGVDDNFCQRDLYLTLAAIDTTNTITADPGTAIGCDNPNILLTCEVNNFNPQYTYTYIWDTPDGSFVSGPIGNIAIINAPGTYTCDVTIEAFDQRGPVECVATQSFIVITSDANGVDVSSTAQTPSSCGSTLNGTATVSPSGGTSPYMYQWDAAAGYQATPTATGLAPGTYSVTVTDASMCENITSVEVLATPIVEMDAMPTIVNVPCFGELTGSATVNATGGTGAIDYVWDSNAGGQLTATATGLGVGTYSVTASDESGCQDEIMVNIIQPSSAVSGVIDAATASACGQATGSISITPSGGTAPYGFAWSNSTNMEDLVNVAAGAYEVTITDDLGCSIVLSESVPNADGPSIDAINVTDVDCFGNSSGGLDLVISGGATPYIIDWDGAPDNNPTPIGLPPGVYTVLVTDQNSCTVSGTATIEEPDQLSAVVIPTQSDCNASTGSLQLTVTGGVTIDTYVWDLADNVEDPTGLPADTYNVVVTDLNGCTVGATGIIEEPSPPVGTSAQTDINCFGDNNGTVSIDITSGNSGLMYDWGNPTLNGNASNGNLAPGVYNVMVTDDANCTASFSETVSQPDDLIIELLSANDPSCQAQDGSININVTGGTVVSDYSFDWNSGDYNTQNISPLPAGSYTLVVSDENNCTVEASYTLMEPETFEPAESNTDISCNTFVDGSIDITETNGSGIFSYAWSDTNIGNTPNATGLGVGLYDVTITDSVTGCIESVQQIEITEPVAIDVDAMTVIDATCLNNDGSIDASVTGGAGNFTLSWNGPGVVNVDDEDLSSLASGEYILDVLDMNNCPASLTVNIGMPAAPTISGTATDILCNGEASGTIQAVTSNPNGNVTYAWSDASQGNTDLAEGLAAGVYTATVTDDLNCTAELVNMVIEEPDAIVIQSDGLETDCDVDNGSINLTVSGGTVMNGYSYDWLDIDDVEDPTGLGQGTYYVTVLDDNNCPAEATVVIEQPLPAVVTSATVPANCFDELNGSINLEVDGQNAPYNFTWTGATIPNTTEDPTGLGAGIYSVIVSDDDGCTTEVTNIEIVQPEILALTFTTEDASCNLPNGSIDVDVTGGSGDIDYIWTPALADQPDHIGMVNSGTYELEIMDENGCSTTETIVVFEPNPLAVLAENGSTLSCFGDANGTASVVIEGGNITADYSYDWGSNYPNAPMIDGLSEGVYPVVVTDADGCIINAVAVVNQPTPIVINLEGSTNPSCETDDGSIDISVSGGTSLGSYTYDWNLGTYDTEDISGLGSGTYNVTVTDDNNCPAAETFSVQAPGSFMASETNQGVTCNSFNNGVIDVSTDQGSGVFNYAWSDPSIGNTSLAENLTPGFYNVTITDTQTGCENTISTIEIEEPDAIAIAAIPTDPTCLNNNGAIDATVVGGFGDLYFNWSGPGTNEITEDLTGLSEGEYILNVLDDNNCPQTQSFTITMPDDPTLSATPTDALCFEGATGIINAPGSSPNGMLSYTWSDASIGDTNMAENLAMGTYSVTVTDPLDCTAEVLSIIVGEPAPIDVQFMTTDSDCDVDNGTIELIPTGGVGNFTFNWQDLPNTQNHTGVGAGNYPVTIYDGNDCPAEIVVPVDVPNAADVSFATINNNCFNQSLGSIDLTVVGSNGPYTFDWTGANIPNTTEDPTGLPAGTYAVVVSDADGCDTPIAGIEIVEGTEIVSIDPELNPAICGEMDGSISLDIQGGTSPYGYTWFGGTIGDTPNPNLLGNGVYNVTVTDALGCTFTQDLELFDPAGVQFSVDQVDILCNGGNNGSAEVNIQSGTDPITISWTSSAMPNIPDGPIALNLIAGSYTALVVDGLGCETELNYSITEPTALTSLSNTALSISCFGFSDGSAQAQPVGGTPPYTYAWSNGGDQQEATGLSADIPYIATITDDHGCIFESPAVTLGQPDELILTGTPEELLCNDGADAAIQLSTIGGNNGAALDYDWSANSNQFDGMDLATGLGAGTYSVTVTEVALGCTDEITVVIDNPPGMEMTAEVSDYDGFNVSCFNETDGSIEVNTVGGTGIVTYQWDDPAGTTTPEVSGLGQGTYNVTATDANGCTEEFAETITPPEQIALDLLAEDVRCAGDANGVVVVTETQGGASPFMYGIDNGPLSSSSIFNNLTAGTYDLMTEDANGCQEQTTFTIAEPDSLTVALGDDQEIAYGESVTLTADIVTGGSSVSLTWGNEAILCPDGNCSNITVQPLVTTTYRVTVIDENGCQHEDDIQVRVRKDRNVFIPNAFNPNSVNPDNNIFQIFTGPGVTMVEEFIVVDRWGEIVYRIPKAYDPNVGVSVGWDGRLNDKALNPAVFVYYAKVRFLDNEVLEYAGDVTLLK